MPIGPPSIQLVGNRHDFIGLVMFVDALPTLRQLVEYREFTKKLSPVLQQLIYLLDGASIPAKMPTSFKEEYSN
jgi:hypothetical protein